DLIDQRRLVQQFVVLGQGQRECAVATADETGMLREHARPSLELAPGPPVEPAFGVDDGAVCESGYRYRPIVVVRRSVLAPLLRHRCKDHRLSHAVTRRSGWRDRL